MISRYLTRYLNVMMETVVIIAMIIYHSIIIMTRLITLTIHMHRPSYINIFICVNIIAIYLIII